MNCESMRRDIILDLYGELDAEARQALHGHLASCPACAAREADERRLFHLLRPGPETAGADDPLLEECRARLRDTLAAVSGPAPAGEAIGRRLPGWWVRLRPVPALAGALLLAAGFILGRFGPAGMAPGRAGAGSAGTLATVNDLQSDPGSDQISLHYDLQRSATLEGTASDPDIRRLLVETARGSLNSGLRLEALQALRAVADEDDVRRTFLAALHDDDNPGARLKAIEGLARSAGRDGEIRDAILQALQRDANPGVRVRAIDALEASLGTDRAPEVLPVFERLAREDPNDYVRLRSAAYVSHAAMSGGSR